MDLPNKAKAFIQDRKLHDYLLSSTHPVGKAKVNFFYNHGFSIKDAAHFKNELLRIAHENKGLASEKTP